MRALALVLFLFSSLAYSQLINLSDNLSSSVNPYIVSNKNVVYVLWEDNNNGRVSLSYKNYSAGNWSASKKMITSDSIHLSSVCIEDSDIVHVLWIAGTGKNSRLMYGRFVEAEFVDSAKIFQDDSSEVIFSSCFYDKSTGRVHISWDVRASDSFYTYYSYKEKNEDWPAQQVVTTSSGHYGNPRAQLVKDKEGIICLWHGDSGDTTALFMKRKLADSWISGSNLPSQYYEGSDFVAQNDNSLNVYVVYHSALLTCPCNGLRYSLWDGSQWSQPEGVPVDNEHNKYVEKNNPSLYFSKNNSLIVAWEQDVYNDYTLDFVYRIIGTAVKTDTGWHVNANIKLARMPAQPAIIVDSSNFINYVWQDSVSGNYDIYFYKTSLLTPVMINNPPSFEQFSLRQNYPNPFNPSTKIEFELPTTNYITLKVFDLLGREIATLVHERVTAGIHSVEWNASQTPSGIYFYRLQAGTFTETKKLILLR